MTVATLQPNSELRDLYQELILDHSRRPRNFGKLQGATHIADGINPLCGDKLRLYLQLDENQVVAAAFEGTGCAISVASASLLTELVVGLDRAIALNHFQEVVAHLNGKLPAGLKTPELGKIQALEGVREFPARIKCATLAWQALESAISGQSGPATTE